MQPAEGGGVVGVSEQEGGGPQRKENKNRNEEIVVDPSIGKVSVAEPDPDPLNFLNMDPDPNHCRSPKNDSYLNLAPCLSTMEEYVQLF